MEPHIDAYPDGSCPVLVCPHCGSLDTQHLKVEIFKKIEIFREIEVLQKQKKSVTSFDVDIDQGEINEKNNRENDGVRIIFCCECCSKKFALEIVQHGGSSHIDVRKER
jgi:hypothetical protein